LKKLNIVKKHLLTDVKKSVNKINLEVRVHSIIKERGLYYILISWMSRKLFLILQRLIYCFQKMRYSGVNGSRRITDRSKGETLFLEVIASQN